MKELKGWLKFIAAAFAWVTFMVAIMIYGVWLIVTLCQFVFQWGPLW